MNKKKYICPSADTVLVCGLSLMEDDVIRTGSCHETEAKGALGFEEDEDIADEGFLWSSTLADDHDK